MVQAKTVASAAVLLVAAQAHMLVVQPAPFSTPQLSNGPLEADGSNFPCKKVTGTDFSGTATSMALGSNQTMKFQGGATHGGGSCQISISYDTNPTADSVWKVIHSIEGGCPARNTAGNIGDDASSLDPDTYEYTIPDNIPSGKATFAWSWLNRVGNREFYMNCGALELTGSGGDQTNYDALPDLFVANLAGINTCTTSEGTDVIFANPGSSVENNIGAFGSQTPNACTGKYTGGSGSGSSSGGSSSASSVAGSSAAASETAPAASSSAPGGVFITTGAGSQPTTTAAAATPTTQAATPAASSAAPTSGGSGSSSSASALTGACTTEGEWNCIGGSSFQQCASGQWSTVMSMAGGTECSVGTSSTLQIESAGKKRFIRAFRA